MHLAQQRAADSLGASASFDRALKLYARIALSASFLCAIGSRFGWWGPNVGWGNFENFTAYTAKVNSFMPAATIPFMAWAATVAEFSLGVALLFGLWLRWTALAAAGLLLIFASYGNLVWHQGATRLFRVLCVGLRVAVVAPCGQ